MGKGALIEKTLRQNQHIDWEWAVYVDGMLIFGLRLAHSKLFNALADSLEWCIAWDGVDSMSHYLDDFAVVVVPPD